jgi:hypothetical protein
MICPKVKDNDVEIVLFADDTSVIVTNSNQGELQTAGNKTLSDIISWFKANFLSLNLNETHYLQYRTKNCTDTTFDINYFNITIANVLYTEFLGLMIDDTVAWDNHIDQLFSRLNSAFYAVRSVKVVLSWKALRKLYFPYVNSLLPYSKVFGVTPLIVLTDGGWWRGGANL